MFSTASLLSVEIFGEHSCRNLSVVLGFDVVLAHARLSEYDALLGSFGRGFILRTPPLCTTLSGFAPIRMSSLESCKQLASRLLTLIFRVFAERSRRSRLLGSSQMWCWRFGTPSGIASRGGNCPKPVCKNTSAPGVTRLAASSCTISTAREQYTPRCIQSS